MTPADFDNVAELLAGEIRKLLRGKGEGAGNLVLSGRVGPVIPFPPVIRYGIAYSW